MKYALFVYDVSGSWHGVPTEQKHALHDQYRDVGAAPNVVGHYRIPPPENTTTVRVEDDHIVNTKGPLADTRQHFRAMYLIERDEYASVLELAARVPAARMGGAVEVWPLRER